MKNRECGRKGVPLKLANKDSVHINPDGSEIVIKKVTDEQYFSKRKKSDYAWGSSWLFPNHLYYNGWLHMNDLVGVDIEELDEKWS